MFTKSKTTKCTVKQPVKPKDKNYIIIDYPQENEIINHPGYTIRIGASGNGVVEVSIDGGTWKQCHHSVGYWWYGWSNYPKGARKIIARLRDNNGKILKKSEVRNCTYQI